MNSVNLIGRITKDPELKTASNGKVYSSFTLAVNEYSNGTQYTQFVPCFVWEKSAENLVKYVRKGAQISVEGSINVRQDNNNGQYSTSITVRVNRIQFLDRQSNTGVSTQGTFANTQQQTDSNKTSTNMDFDLIEDSKISNADDSILWED
ncbi:single-stranded DNA-binding protein [Spiroplasma apis]|uniref:Single-stranded DNA-binding protein n=1 Tax=Spiroplasma apis B31 TaxID=1276258 RepID=V5RJ91_SPIAP|nr:single-stranded DNA-binding protein [Spiroplasma apis]AHB35870.1 single-strand DNA-binding protein [Spiroplasma apis B31]